MALFGGIEIPGHPDLSNVRKLDLLAIPMIRRAHRLGIAINREYMWDLGTKFAAELVELEKDISSYIPSDRLHEFSSSGEDDDDSDSFNAGSPEQIAKLLFDILDIKSDKPLKQTKAGKTSTGKKQLETIRLSHPVVAKVLRHRELNKLSNTYCKKLPKLAKFHPHGRGCPICGLSHLAPTWRIHGEMGTTRAETGRINHKNPNLGNIPARTKDGQAVQAGFCASPGHKLVSCDLSQIELRCLAHLANCSSMIVTYENDGDIHTETCYRTGLTPPDRKPTVAERMGAKRCGFGIQNGTTEKGLYLQLVMDFGAKGELIPEWLTEDWCKWFIKQWLEDRWEVKAFFDLCHYRARRYGLSWEPLGRARLIPELMSQHSWIREAGLRQAQNMPVTSLAAGQLKLAMGKSEYMLQCLLDAGVWCWPLLTIHDAIMVEAEEDGADDVAEVLQESMNTIMRDEQTGEQRFRTQIKSDVEIMTVWKKG